MFALRLQASEASLKNMICAAGKRSEPVSTKLVYQARSVLICSRYAARLRVRGGQAKNCSIAIFLTPSD
jgi:hypothetical protein